MSVPVWLLSLIVAVAVCGSVAAWTVFATRPATLAYQPRRHVPWGGIHLGLVLLVYLALLTVAGLLIGWLLPPALTQSPDVRSAEESDATHLIVRLFVQGDLGVLLVCALSAVVVAPIVEEFFFRVLLQGWLEARQRRLRPRMPVLRRLVPGAAGPIVLTSVLFARMHFHLAAPLPPVYYMTLMLAADAAAKLVATAFAVVLLRFHLGATAADLGWVRERFFRDVGLGLLSFVALAAPLYAVQLGLLVLLPGYVAPDPFVLFPFSIALGYLYYRTHRIVPAIVLHMALNATSLALLLLMIGLQ